MTTVVVGGPCDDKASVDSQEDISSDLENVRRQIKIRTQSTQRMHCGDGVRVTGMATNQMYDIEISDLFCRAAIFFCRTRMTVLSSADRPMAKPG
jgi:hypothetical protein